MMIGPHWQHCVLIFAATLCLPGCSWVSGPRITGFTPTTGPHGTQVIVQGSRLDKSTVVRFGGVPSNGIIFNSKQQIQARVPMGTPTGSVSIEVENSIGSDTGPYDFTVLGLEYLESDTANNQQGSADEVPDDHYVVGSIRAIGDGDDDDVDWYQFKGGPDLDVWAYTVAFLIDNQATQSNARLDLTMQVIEDKFDMPIIEVPTHPAVTRWITLRPNQTLSVRVKRGGSSVEIPYQIQVGRIPLDDPYEPNDDAGSAAPLPVTGTSWFSQEAYLTPRYNRISNSARGLEDWYSIPGVDEGEEIGVAVGYANFGFQHPVRLELHGPEGGPPITSVAPSVASTTTTITHKVMSGGSNQTWKLLVTTDGGPNGEPFMGTDFTAVPARAQVPHSLLITVK